MTAIAALWLPIVVSTVLVFIASSIIHMAPLWHRKSNPAVPNQDRVMDALRPFGIPPGEYMVPRAESHEAMKAPEFVEKLNRGPVMLMTVVQNGPLNMGKSLFQWLVYVLLVGVLTAYVAGNALDAGAPYLTVFRIAGSVAFIGYAVALWQQSIWYARPWSTTFKFTLDGAIYALLTAGAFGWLWPAVG